MYSKVDIRIFVLEWWSKRTKWKGRWKHNGIDPV